MFRRVLVALSCCASLASLPALASSAGIIGYSGREGALCTQCHAAGAGTAPTVTLTGPTTLAPGASGSYVLTISGGPGVGSGMNVAASSASATLAPIGGGMAVTAGELHHTTPRAFSGGQVQYLFNLTAPPTAGTVTLYAAGNSTNGSGVGGDRVAAATLAVSVQAGNNPPTIAQAASATPSPVRGTTTTLSVLGADDGGEPALSYRWTSSGPAPVTFSPNDTNAAKSTTATFTAPGSYTFTATVRDAMGLTATSQVAVTVSPAVAQMTVVPANAGVAPGGSLRFSATAVDQFGAAIVPAPTWSVSGGGTILADGTFTAGTATGGPHTVTARDGAASATAQVTISAGTAPTVATAARANPAAVSGTTTALSVLGADDGGEAALRYTWSAAGPAAVAFAPNGSNAAKASTATFGAAGQYTLTATIADAASLTVTSQVVVAVTATATRVEVTPAQAVVPVGGTHQLAARVLDQFALPLAGAPAVTWSVSGGGTIDADGTFRAGSTAGGPFTVEARSGSLVGRATVEVSNASAPTVTVPPSAAPAIVEGRSTLLRVMGSDAQGEATLRYRWSATGPAPVTFSVNDANAARTTTASFSQAGEYDFTVTVENAARLTTQAMVSVTVVQTPTVVDVAPVSLRVEPGTTATFAASLRDQFGVASGEAPGATWTVSGGGSIDGAGLFFAQSTPGGPFVVAASAAGIRGTATVQVGDAASVDRQAPVVSLLTGEGPHQGRIILEARADDDVGVVEVRFLVNGQPVGAAQAAPWQAETSAALLGPGVHRLQAIARDAAGNEGRSPEQDLSIPGLPSGGEEALVTGELSCATTRGGPLSWLTIVLVALIFGAAGRSSHRR